MSKTNKILIPVLLLLFGYSAVDLSCYFLNFYWSKKQITNLERMMDDQIVPPYSVIMDSNSPDAISTKRTIPAQGTEMLPEFHSLYAENADIMTKKKIRMGCPSWISAVIFFSLLSCSSMATV